VVACLCSRSSATGRQGSWHHLLAIACRLVFGWTHNTLIPHAKLMRSSEWFYTQVLPRVS
jgi:hypothetical protein